MELSTQGHYATAEQIRYMQVDHTSKCNLLCPQCSRVHKGKLNPILPLQELSIDDYRNVLKHLPNLEEIFFCGNFGDASVSQSFLPSLEYLRGLGIPCLKISTNGSARDPSWWRDLAKVLSKKRDLVAFSIDGLIDTNSIYRVNSSWEKIMQNAEAFIRSGGRARWDFIVFSHNEHQVDEARLLAQKMGFAAFSVKKTNRPLKFEESVVSPPKEYKYIGDALKKISSIEEKYGSWDQYVSNTKIDCRFRQDRIGVFLDFQAKLWPCCWMGAPLFQFDEKEQKPYFQNLILKYGENFNSLRHHSVPDVLAHKWFAQELIKSWKNEADRSVTCVRFCGDGFSYSSESQTNRSVEKMKI